jgi:hypothetical protein
MAYTIINLYPKYANIKTNEVCTIGRKKFVKLIIRPTSNCCTTFNSFRRSNISTCVCICICRGFTIKFNASVTSRLPDGTSRLTAKCYKILPTRLKYHYKNNKSTYLYCSSSCRETGSDSCVQIYQCRIPLRSCQKYD